MYFANVSKGTAYKHIDNLQKLELIRKQTFQDVNGSEMYEVRDPRILHLMSRAVITLE